MAFGTKTNERPGTRAQVRYLRVSPSKAREVLDKIRGKSYGAATEYLTFSERAVSGPILKCLDSAVANAENNDGIPAEELYVSACYADEGPTLKRWRPRARGRATRIRKRTCHITVIVSRYDDEALEALRTREAAAGRSGSSQAAEARRARVAQSKARQAEQDHDHDHDHDEIEPSVEDQASEIVAATAAEMEAAGEDYDDTKADSDADDIVDAEDATPFGPLSHAPLEDVHEAPEGYPIKGNADSMKYHQPDGRWYEQTVAEVWFATPEAAEEAGFSEAGKSSTEEEE